MLVVAAGLIEILGVLLELDTLAVAEPVTGVFGDDVSVLGCDEVDGLECWLLARDESERSRECDD